MALRNKDRDAVLGRNFTEDYLPESKQEVKHADSRYFSDKDKIFFYEDIQKLIERSEKCSIAGRKYIDEGK